MNKLLISALKNARIKCGLKQKEVAEQLEIRQNTISGWESGRCEPDIDSFVQLCEIYKIDCASLLADVYAFERIEKDVTLEEFELVRKYRKLDSSGQGAVNFMIDHELERVQGKKEKQEKTAI
jgi:transcriptional regulator with XRE-family HTH domain